MYGSSRLGMWHPMRDVESTNWWLYTTTAMTRTDGGRAEKWTRGNVQFELSNHLGNVLVTISDRKIQVADNASVLVPKPILRFDADVLTADDYYPFGMQLPGRRYALANVYRFGFNGKENDNDVKGEGNQQDYGFRIYDPSLARFLTVDPILKEYPELTPYQFASNRPGDGIDIDGLEYKSAADWAQQNIDDYSIQFTTGYEYPPTFKSLRSSNWRDIIGKQMYCATSTALAYAHGNRIVADQLQKTGYVTNRLLQLDYFTKGNRYASLIKPKNFTEAKRGDLIFLQDPSNIGSSGAGHVGILASNTRTKGEKSFTVNVYSTNAGNSNDPARVGTFGEVIYFFSENGKRDIQLVTKYWWDYDNKVYRMKDMRDENLVLQGFGRVDEEKIVQEKIKKQNKQQTETKENESN